LEREVVLDALHGRFVDGERLIRARRLPGGRAAVVK